MHVDGVSSFRSNLNKLGTMMRQSKKISALVVAIALSVIFGIVHVCCDPRKRKLVLLGLRNTLLFVTRSHIQFAKIKRLIP